MTDLADQYDAERHTTGQLTLGGPVDPPDEPRTIYAKVVTSAPQPRRPIIAAELRNPDQRREAAKLLVNQAGYHSAYHATRLPKYSAKVAFYAPIGAGRLIGRQIRWAWLTEQSGLRQQAATSGNTNEWLRLHNHARAIRAWRMPILGLEAIAVLIVVVLLVRASWPVEAVAGMVGLTLLALYGRPAGKPITDRVVIGQAFTKLTAEQVRAALCSLGLARIKDPADLQFPAPGIHRDGPGWLARVNLPAGVEVTDVLERRGRLSSALRLPIDQVWPAAGLEHAGQLDLWVGMMPASKMGQPRWSLSSDTARTSVFDEHEFGTDQRQRPVKTTLFARNFLIGGVPGSGKSYAARAIAMVAALDPTCELRIAEFKGTADFGDLGHLCTTYVCGVDEQAISDGAGIIRWGLAEAERRGKRIRAARERGEAPEGKVTPELAARPGSGLHPVLILIDEAHELLCDKDVADDAERLIKRGRALGLIVVLATQIPDAKSLPPNITRCVNMRWCLAVQDQVANDMILGTGAYKRGDAATVYRPGHDAGWGIFTGLAQTTAVRSHFPKPEIAAKMVARATVLRGGNATVDTDLVEARDVLGDVRRVFYAGEAFVSWASLTSRLASQEPDVYGGLTQDALSATVRAFGLDSRDGKERGSRRTVKGLRLEHLAQAIAAREIEAPK